MNTMKILFFSLSMIFAPINIIASNKVALLYNLYKNKRTAQLCRVIYAGDLMYNGDLIPVILYEELQKKPQHRFASSERPEYNPLENNIIVTEENFFSTMEQCDINNLSK